MDNERNKEQKEVTELDSTNPNANAEAQELEDKDLEDASGGQLTNGNCGC